MIVSSVKYCLVIYNKENEKFYIEYRLDSGDVIYRPTNCFNDYVLIFNTYNEITNWIKNFIKSEDFNRLVKSFHEEFDFECINIVKQSVVEEIQSSIYPYCEEGE